MLQLLGVRHVLNSLQKKKLKEGLTEPPHPDPKVVLVGERYLDLASKLEERLKVAVSPRSIRYYVQALQLEKSDWKRRPLRKGRPKKLKLSPSELLVKHVSEYLIKLSGLSESSVFALLQTATKKLWPTFGKVTFHNLFKDTRTSRSYQLFDESDDPVDHCCIVLGQSLLTEGQDCEHWMLLWGIDAMTAFVNFQLINLIQSVDLAQRTQGRPKLVPKGIAAHWAATGETSTRVILPDQVLLEFLGDCQSRLGLPVSRVILPVGYTGLTSCKENTDVILHQIIGGEISLSLPAECLAAIPKADKLRKVLGKAMARHNKIKARSRANELRKDFKGLADKYRSHPAKNYTKYMNRLMPGAMALCNFYDTHSPFRSTCMFRQIKLIRLFLEKKPESSGEADPAQPDQAPAPIASVSTADTR